MSYKELPIVKEITEVCGIRDEVDAIKDECYLLNYLCVKANELPECEWDKLSEAAKRWYNISVVCSNSAAPLPVPTDEWVAAQAQVIRDQRRSSLESRLRKVQNQLERLKKEVVELQTEFAKVVNG